MEEESREEELKPSMGNDVREDESMDEDEPEPVQESMSDSSRADSPVEAGKEKVDGNDEYMDLEEEMSKDKQQLLDEYERRKKARQVNVSTDDKEVAKQLRKLGQPICLFGEGPADRRNRLKNILSRSGDGTSDMRKEAISSGAGGLGERDRDSTWYHEGPDALRQARWKIAKYSLWRAKERLQRVRNEQAALTESNRTARKQELHKYLASLTIHSSQIGDNRPIPYCSFSSDSSMIATASWSGLCKVWSVPDCEQLMTLKGHECQVGAIVFHPQATWEAKSEGQRTCCMASCATDGTVNLWNFASDKPLASLPGHSPNRVSRLQFHPSGGYLGTCCYDNSWRLWDVHTRQELLHQEGHCKPVHCLSFQCDGSVLATGGLDSFGRVWDLRSGRCIMFMEGHLHSIYAIDFSPNGYHLVTGSEDNSAKIWDLRKRSCIYTIAAHMNLISAVKYQPRYGHYLITSSYDNTARIWCEKTWQPLKTLSGHDGKLMNIDISPDCRYIATSSYDRTFKLWAPE